MRKHSWLPLIYALFFLILLQLTGTLVESIYILNLLNASLNANALGLLFFFTPAALLLFRKRPPASALWALTVILILSRALIPYLDTSPRLLAAGIGTGAALLLLPLLLTTKVSGSNPGLQGLMISGGFALSCAFSVLLRTLGYGLDYSLLSAGAWLGWALGAGFGISTTVFDWRRSASETGKASVITLPLLGVFLAFTMLYFTFSAPSVLARWTEGNYISIVCTISLLSLAWTWVSIYKPAWIAKVTLPWRLLWNLLFALSLTVVILTHQVSFPVTPDSPAVIVESPTWAQQIPLILTLLLFPVIFFDLYHFCRSLGQIHPGKNSSTPRAFAPGMLLGSFSLVLLIFIQIFTNVWGYVEPVSPWFRGKFWLPYLLMSGCLTVLVGWKGSRAARTTVGIKASVRWEWSLLLWVIFIVTAAGTFHTTRIRGFPSTSDHLLVMTYNIQQANDEEGEKSFERQLALMERVAPDIIGLQESDSSRVSLNNNDYVRYFAGKLGYHSYYGPKSVNGTYGTAILSKHPLQNTQSIYSYSDQDEIGTAAVQIEIDGQTYTIYNVHPDGSDTAMLVFARTLLDQAAGKANVIALGDYNLREGEEAYQLIASVYKNAWQSTEQDTAFTDLTGLKPIDHIFISPHLNALRPVYLLPPDSATDHPVHWAEINWRD